MNERPTIEEIISKYPDITQDEQIILDNWLAQDNNTELFQTIINKRYHQELLRIEQLKGLNEASWLKLNHKLSESSIIRGIWWQGWRIVAAACIISVIAVGGYMWYQNKSKSSVSQVNHEQLVSKKDIEPGSFKAKLILSDGAAVLLDTTTSTSFLQGDVTVVNKEGELVYKVNKLGKTGAEPLYNTLQTTQGQTFSTVLSDGTKVWLNSDASIYYPVVFGTNERKVVVTGEVYFEVAKGETPFIVSGGLSLSKEPNWSIRVLGTHFNINAYPDEEMIKTTLLEGKVEMVAGSRVVMLAPGQQAQLIRDKMILKIENKINVGQVIAWKNGYFQFINDDLKSVMKTISRWYNVEVVYRKPVPKETYYGKVKRDSRLSEVLPMLEQDGLRFSILGRTIFVE